MRSYIYTLIPTILVAACGAANPTEPAATGPNYATDVRPLLSKYCVGCHKAGGVAPFVLDTHEAARTWAAPIASAVRDRRMPPFLADGSGRCGEFRANEWLSEAHIVVFEDWASTGAPAGDLSTPPPPPRLLPKLSGEIHRVDIGADYLPDQSKTDDYRCFVVEAPGAFGVTGFNVVPGNPSIVHHLIAYQVASQAAASQARDKDSNSPGPGYDCLGTGPGVEATSVAGWAPGAGADLFPAGMSVELAEGRPMILEVHYNVAGGPQETDRTTLELQVAPPGRLRPMLELAALDYDFIGPVNSGEYTTTDDYPVSWQLPEGTTGQLRLLSANAHMHRRGVSQRLERVKANGEVECLLDIPRWDFNWQRTYWYANPINIEMTDTLRITCTFDTNGATEPITWGEGTNDEMCLASFFVAFE